MGSSSAGSPAEVFAVPARGRVVLDCIECGEAVSWPLTRERNSGSVTNIAAPEAGRLRVVEHIGEARWLITAIESARMPSVASVKQARTCPNGHFVGNMRTEPHDPPFHMQFATDRIRWRMVDQ